MVVVENARHLIGQEVELVVTSTLQTSAGRMIFGRCGPANGDNDGHGAQAGGSAHVSSGDHRTDDSPSTGGVPTGHHGGDEAAPRHPGPSGSPGSPGSGRASARNPRRMH
jgi:hypothetical protein